MCLDGGSNDPLRNDASCCASVDSNNLFGVQLDESAIGALQQLTEQVAALSSEPPPGWQPVGDSAAILDQGDSNMARTAAWRWYQVMNDPANRHLIERVNRGVSVAPDSAV
jgi:hypothetical protein